jgi:hypothetical protein
VLFLCNFSVESGVVVGFVVVVDIVLVMLGAGGLSIASLNASSAMVKSSLVFYVALVLKVSSVCRWLLNRPPTIL